MYLTVLSILSLLLHLLYQSLHDSGSNAWQTVKRLRKAAPTIRGVRAKPDSS